jgi:hypothetical protein
MVFIIGKPCEQNMPFTYHFYRLTFPIFQSGLSEFGFSVRPREKQKRKGMLLIYAKNKVEC